MAARTGSTKALRESPVIPDSKLNADPQPPAYDWSKYTINGQPIPEGLWPNMTYHITDQAMEERAAKRGPAPVTRVTRDAEDKRIDTFRDGLKTGNLITGKNPQQYMMDKHLPKGMAGLWIGAKKAELAGLVRSGLEYEPVLIDDPKNPGQKMRVTQGGMFLAAVPIEHKQEAEAFYSGISSQKLQALEDKVRETSDKVMSEEGLDRFARRKRMQSDLAGLTVEDDDQGDNELAQELSEQLAHERG